MVVNPLDGGVHTDAGEVVAEGGASEEPEQFDVKLGPA